MDANCHHTGEAGGGSGETRSGMNSAAEPLAEAPSGSTVRQGQPVTHRQTGRGLQRPHPLQQGGSPPPYLPSPRGAPGLRTAAARRPRCTSPSVSEEEWPSKEQGLSSAPGPSHATPGLTLEAGPVLGGEAISTGLAGF